MSNVCGKRRVVLSPKKTPLGNRLVCICGSEETSANRPGSKAGSYHPLGYWYKDGGLFYVDLKSPDQWYDSVNKETIANKRLGGLATKQALREYVMGYWDNKRAQDDAARRMHRYTQRCQMIEEHARLTTEEE